MKKKVIYNIFLLEYFAHEYHKACKKLTMKLNCKKFTACIIEQWVTYNI